MGFYNYVHEFYQTTLQIHKKCVNKLQLIQISWKLNILSRLTVVSHEAKKKQHARASSGLCDHYSELFTRMASLKFENAVTQPP